MRLTSLTRLLLMLMTITGCHDVLVPDISDENIQLVSPTDSLVSSSQFQHFFWERLEGAEEYNVRIVSPGFQSPTIVVMDTSITENQLRLTLPFGEYEWNVVAINSAYSSQCCQTFRLFIKNDSSSNLSNQVIVLNSPMEGLQTSNPAVEFNWEPLIGAEFYLFQLGDANFNNLLVDEQLGFNVYTQIFSADGQYHWRIRGVNETSLTMTAWREGSITIDRESPAIPESQFPDNGDTLDIAAQSPDLYWQSDQESTTDTVYIYNNVQRDVLVLQSPTATSAVDLDGTAIDQGSNLQDYFWEVISVDLAGNKSPKSPLFRFFVRQ